MPALVPESPSRFGFHEPFDALGLALDALLELTRAECGWIGLADPLTGLSFPVRRGRVPEVWLDRRAGRDGVWGFAVRDGPILFNDLLPLPGCEASPLSNLCSCSLPSRSDVCGHVAVSNKPGGFTPHDAAVVQGFAHLVAKLAAVDSSRAQGPRRLVGLPSQVLELSEEGVFLLDARGTLVFANATWSEWTGLSVDELLGQQTPFSFWLDQRQLAMLGVAASPRGPATQFSPTGGVGEKPGEGSESLPFRRADETIFWCRVQTRRTTWDGSEWTIAWLRRLPEIAEEPPAIVESAANWSVLLLRPGLETAWWNERWTKLTGLNPLDMAGVPVETVLDWLFPSQPDRDFVADLLGRPARKRTGTQAVLRVLEPNGSRPLRCTFLPIASASRGLTTAGDASDAWLLLVSEVEIGTAAAAGGPSSDHVVDEVKSVRPDPISQARESHPAPGLAPAAGSPQS